MIEIFLLSLAGSLLISFVVGMANGLYERDGWRHYWNSAVTTFVCIWILIGIWLGILLILMGLFQIFPLV